MHIALSLVVVFAAALVPVGGESRIPPYVVTKAVTAPLRSAVATPNVVENGSNLILFPYAGFDFYANPQTVAFTPDGAAYFGVTEVANTITRLSPSGTFGTLSVPFAGRDVVYAHGMLWTGSYNGVVAFTPDGKRHRDYYLGAPIISVIQGNQGSVYAVASIYDAITKSSGGKLFRIGGSAPPTSVVLPVRPLGSLALGADGLPYFGYQNDATGAFGIARVERSGAATLFPITGYGAGVQRSYNLVLSRGYLYFSFIGNVPPGGGTAPLLFARISQTGAITQLATPTFASLDRVSTLSVDKGGNIWMIVGSLGNNVNSGLFQYDVYTGKYSGPYATSPYAGGLGPGPFVGPDDNVYFFISTIIGGATTTFAAYVSHVQTLEPGSLSLVSGSSSAFAIRETHFNGPWTARSANPSVAGVTPAISATGEFTVTKTGRGSTSIVVEDRLGNTSNEPVSSP